MVKSWLLESREDQGFGMPEEGLLCGENGDVLFIESGFSEEAEPPGEVPGSVLGDKTEKCFTVLLKQQSFCKNRSPSSSLALALLESTLEMLKDNETIA